MSIKGSLLLFAAILLLPIHCFCRGFYAHQKINYQAVFLLPRRCCGSASPTSSSSATVP